MKISKTVRKFLAIDLLIGVGITVVAWDSLGQEGMAKEFCDQIHLDQCDEIEWEEDDAEDQVEGREAVTREADQVTPWREKATSLPLPDRGNV